MYGAWQQGVWMKPRLAVDALAREFVEFRTVALRSGTAPPNFDLLRGRRKADPPDRVGRG